MKHQAKDIADQTVIEIVRCCNEGTCEHEPRGTYINNKGHWCFTWEVAEKLNLPLKLVLAKLRKMIKRGLLNGCACGCRGDLELPC